MVAPVTNPPPVPVGSPSNSVTQRSATPVSIEAAGDITDSAAFWSQAAISQAAACATGNAPPVTKPKYLGPPLATVAGEPASSSRASTAAASKPAPGRAKSSCPSAATSAAAGATGRSASPAR